ncbi:hypothetical protein GCM10018966_086440 [Streptomyces yanii]
MVTGTLLFRTSVRCPEADYSIVGADSPPVVSPRARSGGPLESHRRGDSSSSGMTPTLSRSYAEPVPPQRAHPDPKITQSEGRTERARRPARPSDDCADA